MIEKPKRPTKIPNQDNKQPQTINELIRRYDLDNTKIYDFLDSLVTNLNTLQNSYRKKILWENNMTSAVFPEQTITLNTADYDYLIIYSYRNAGLSYLKSITTIIEKNMQTEINYSDYLGEIRTWNRAIEITNDTSVKFYRASINGVNSETNDGTLVPYKIIGCKY